MSIARELAKLERWLAAQHPALDLFSADSTPELGELSRLAALRERIPAIVLTDGTRILKLALQALRIQQQQHEDERIDAQFVATLPASMPVDAYATAKVVREMLSGSPTEVIVIGYEISSESFLGRLRELATQGTRVTLIVDETQTPMDKLAAGWPSSNRPSIYVGRPDRDKAIYAKMHSKALLVDNVDLLVTSANFTFHGLEGNIEFGIRMRGKRAADARGVFDHMLASGAMARV